MKKDLVAASAEPLILSLLALGENYGYEIIQRIRSCSEDKIIWTDGMLYPVLHRLEDKGWIASRWTEGDNGRKRKYYSISPRGKKALNEQRADWQTVDSVLMLLWENRHV